METKMKIHLIGFPDRKIRESLGLSEMRWGEREREKNSIEFVKSRSLLEMIEWLILRKEKIHIHYLFHKNKKKLKYFL